MSLVQLPAAQDVSGRFVSGRRITAVKDATTGLDVTGFTTAEGLAEVTYPLVSGAEGQFEAFYPTGTVNVHLSQAQDGSNPIERVELISGEDVASGGLSGSADEAITGNWSLAPTGGAGTVTAQDLAVAREAPLNINYPEFGGSLSAGITAVNAAPGSRLGIYVPGETTVGAKLPTLTRGDVSIFGDGPGGSKIALTGGELIQIGDDASSAIANVQVRDLIIDSDATGLATDHLFELRNCSEVTVSDLRVADIAGLVNSGSATANAGRYTFRDISGNYNDAGTNTKVIEHVNGSGIRFEKVRITSSAYLSSTLAHSVFIRPVASGNVIDTVRFESCEIWGDFQQYGVEIVTQNEKVVNLFFNGCVFDATVLAGMRIRDVAGSEFRNLWCTDTRFDTNNGGNAVLISWTGTNPLAGAHFIGCKLGDGSNAAVSATATNNVVTGLEFIGNQVEDGNQATNKTAAFKFSCGGWSAIGNRFYERSSGSSNTDYAIQTLADVNNFVAVGNYAPDTNTGFFNHFAYASNTDSSRVVAANVPDDRVGFYGKTGIAKPTGVAVSAAGIHAALVNLGLISA